MNIFIKLLNHVDTREEYSVDGSIQSTSNLICNASGRFFFQFEIMYNDTDSWSLSNWFYSSYIQYIYSFMFFTMINLFIKIKFNYSVKYTNEQTTFIFICCRSIIDRLRNRCQVCTEMYGK